MSYESDRPRRYYSPERSIQVTKSTTSQAGGRRRRGQHDGQDLYDGRQDPHDSRDYMGPGPSATKHKSRRATQDTYDNDGDHYQEERPKKAPERRTRYREQGDDHTSQQPSRGSEIYIEAYDREDYDQSAVASRAEIDDSRRPPDRDSSARHHRRHRARSPSPAGSLSPREQDLEELSRRVGRITVITREVHVISHTREARAAHRAPTAGEQYSDVEDGHDNGTDFMKIVPKRRDTKDRSKKPHRERRELEEAASSQEVTRHEYPPGSPTRPRHRKKDDSSRPYSQELTQPDDRNSRRSTRDSHALTHNSHHRSGLVRARSPIPDFAANRKVANRTQSPRASESAASVQRPNYPTFSPRYDGTVPYTEATRRLEAARQPAGTVYHGYIPHSVQGTEGPEQREFSWTLWTCLTSTALFLYFDESRNPTHQLIDGQYVSIGRRQG
jgi:hypothetical protein